MKKQKLIREKNKTKSGPFFLRKKKKKKKKATEGET